MFSGLPAEGFLEEGNSQLALGLQRGLVEAFENGNIPKQAIGYTEEEGRIAFQAGKTLFHRNWPYVYGLAATEDSSKVKGKFDVTVLPNLRHFVDRQPDGRSGLSSR